jgi:hypothetical protein
MLSMMLRIYAKAARSKMRIEAALLATAAILSAQVPKDLQATSRR